MIINSTLKITAQKLFKKYNPKPSVSRVVIGIGYTGVELLIENNSYLGVAYTLPDVLSDKECTKIDFAGILTEKPVSDLLQWSLEPPSIRKIVGIATLNAVSQYLLMKDESYESLEEDLFHYLRVDNGSSITFIGLIKPMIRRLSKTTKKITIIEKNLELGPFFKQFTLARNIKELNEEELRTDILICTGTALINGTLDHILDVYRHHADFIALIGPTASLLPDFLFDNGVDLVGGMFFNNPAASLRILQEGGGTKFFKKYGRKYNLIPTE